MKKGKTDFYYQNCGTIILLKPQTKYAKDWVNNNLQVESWQNNTFGVAIEPRYFEAIIDAIRDEGIGIKPIRTTQK